ncbi:MAG: GAF domain-containing protein [Desulfobacter sp.]
MEVLGDSQNQRSLEKTISVLYEISNAVSHTRNLEELYGVIHNALKKILRVDNFFIALHDPERDALSFPYYVDETGRTPDTVLNFSRIPSFLGQVIQSRSPRIFHEKDGRELGLKPVYSNAGISKIWLGTPLVVKERVIGAMVIQDYHSETAYHPGDLSLMNSVSQHVALAIERKEAEAQIRDQGRILEKILEASPVGIALVENRVFKWVNTEMVRMFGYKNKKEFQNKSVEMIYAVKDDFKFAGRTIYEGLSSRGKADYEMDLVKRDRTRFPVHIRLNSTDSSNPMSWTIGTFTDISERRAAEKESFERERLQGVLEMAGAVCHEINQPLQAIIGYSELLQMDPDPTTSGSSLNSIRTQANRLGKITATLANITQYKTVEYPGNTKIVDIWGAGSQEID